MKNRLKNNYCILIFTTLIIIGCDQTQNNPNLFDKNEINKIDSLNRLTSDLITIDLQHADSIAQKTLNNSEIINYKKGIAEANRCLGVINRLKGNYRESFDMLQTSITISEQINFEEGIAKTNNNLGILFKALGYLDDALEYYTLANSSKYIKTDSVLLGIVNTNIANVKVEQKKYEEAIILYNSYLPIFIQLKDTAKIMAIYINYGEAEANRDSGNPDEALNFFKKTNELAELTRDTLFLMLSQKYMGSLMLRNNQLEEAFPKLMLAYDLAEKLGRPQNIYTVATYLKTYYDSIDNEERFKYYQNIMDNVEKELKKDESSKAIATIIKNKKMQIDKTKIKNQKRLIYISLTVLIISTLLIFTLFRSYKHKQEANRLLTEMDELKNRLYSNITHELRTPLTLILGPLEQMLSSETEKVPSRKQVKMMRKNANSLLNLVNQILDLNKIDAKSMKLELVEEDINKFLRTRFAAFASLAEQKSITYQFSLLNEKNIRIFDSSKLEKIINNLISNAVKFTGKNGKISCYANFHKSNTLEIVVEDDGKGIPKDELDKIFNRFHQVKTIDETINIGTGIGLSLTRELVEIMHGKITVESEVGKGSKFTVILPLGTSQLNNDEYQMVQNLNLSVLENQQITETDDIADDSHSDANQINGNKNLPHILIVEDHADIREFIAENLQDSFYVEQSENGKSGLEIAFKTIPDLVITDIVMPEMDGTELCIKLKTDEKTSHIPVVMLTGKSGIDDRLKGLETGADAYLTKPFNIKELRLQVVKLIEQRKKLRERFTRELHLEPRDIAVTSADEKFITRAMEIIEKNIDNSDFEVRQFEEEMFMSRMQLFRKIKALTNQTPGDFIRTIRLKRAASLIKQNFGNIAQITYEVGFNNPSYFAKCFKDLYGELPSDYMKNHS